MQPWHLMMSHRPWLVAACALAACSDQAGANGGSCSPGWTRICNCATGFPEGLSTCQADGTYGECVCNHHPRADAAQPDGVRPGQTVTLDGSGSSDVDGDTLSYLWTVVDRPPGSTSELSDTHVATPTLLVDRPGAYTITLVVSDGRAESEPVEVVVDAGDSMPMNLQISLLSEFPFVRGEPVSVMGSGFDLDDDSLTYRWQLQKPPDSHAEVVPATGATTQFTPDVFGRYQLVLLASDGFFEVSSQTILDIIDQAPVADAGAARAVVAGTEVTLDGTGSADPEGVSLVYRWAMTRRPPGSAAALSGASAAAPTFVPDVDGTYTLQLIVSDGVNDSPPAEVSIIRYQALHALSFPVIAAEESRALGRLVVLASDALHIVDPATGVESVVALEGEAVSLSLAPDGHHAAVGHATAVSLVDLDLAVVTHRWPVASGNGLIHGPSHDVYLFGGDFGLDVLDTQNGALTHKPSTAVYSSGALDPSGQVLYLRGGLSAEKFSAGTDDGSIVSLGTFEDSTTLHTGAFWLTEDGGSLVFDDGAVGATASDAAGHMHLRGQLEIATPIGALADSSRRRAIATIPPYFGPTHPAPPVSFYDDVFFAHVADLDLPPLDGGGAFGRFVFIRASGALADVIVSGDPASGHDGDFAIVTFQVPVMP